MEVFANAIINVARKVALMAELSSWASHIRCKEAEVKIDISRNLTLFLYIYTWKLNSRYFSLLKLE